MDPLFSVLPVQPPVDLKANGEVSRMRSHKGNMPSLPQTKYCPLCPAKFTRTTHLNRHLRSHTNERLHRCNICQAEFTRSDLLTRHKRTCGDNVNANRSRRKSCQACAESKVKCNLQYPCSKCTSRGRECVFINDPEASRNKKLLSAKRKPSLATSSSSGTASPSNSPAGSLFTTSLTSSPSLFTSSLVSTPGSQMATLPLVSPVPSLSVSPGSSSTSSLHSSPRSEFFDNHLDFTGVFDLPFDNFSLEPQLNPTFGEELFNPYADQTLDSSCAAPPLSVTPGDFGSWLDPNGMDAWPLLGDGAPFNFSHGQGDQDFSSFAQLAGPESTIDISSINSTLSASLEPVIPTLPFFDPSTLANTPVNPDLDHYLYLFFSVFCKQIPLVHPATWKMGDKPDALVRAMQACGAMFVKTPAAESFVEETLFMRDSLVQEFNKPTSDPREQNNLILTVVLLQTIGIFHQKSGQRISSNVYHGMLMMMIRRTGLISRVGAWTPPDLADATSIESAWKEWANYETIKRVLFLSYLLDCYHCIYFSLSPSFQPSEIEMALPCDDALWSATNSRDWFTSAHASSPYGVGKGRITGFSMKHALSILGETRLSTVSLALNPFAHFILINTILRNIYAAQIDTIPAGSIGLTSTSTDIISPSTSSTSLGDDTFAVQYALHNWLQVWLNSPESMQMDQQTDDPPFVCDALPFYWLAQVSLLATQDSGTGVSGTNAEGRFRLMTVWLDHIRTFLRGGKQVPTQLWEELLKIRLKLSGETVFATDELSNGLLALFPSI